MTFKSNGIITFLSFPGFVMITLTSNMACFFSVFSCDYLQYIQGSLRVVSSFLFFFSWQFRDPILISLRVSTIIHDEFDVTISDIIPVI